MERLSGITEGEVRARSSESSFQRGQRYYAEGAVRRRILQGENHLEAYVEGSQTYQVSVWLAGAGKLQSSCTCPYDYGGHCKHIVATLLAWLAEPESFQAPADLKASLNRRTKKELVSLLSDILEVYPHLAGEFEIVAASSHKDLAQKAAALFEDVYPRGHLSEAEAEAHIRLIARQADRLAEKGQTDLARRTYYALLFGCVDFGRRYGNYDIFSGSVIHTLATAYNDLAAAQVTRQGATIRAELEEIYRDLYDPDWAGLDQALADTWAELDEQEEITHQGSTGSHRIGPVKRET